MSLDLEGAVLSLWVEADGDAWFSGGTTGPEGGFILHLTDDLIRREITPPGPLLWWVTGIDSDHLWAVGEGGRIISRRDGSWRDESPDLSDKAILYGAWAATEDDVWAVGGSIRRDGPKGLVLRSTGDGMWRRIESPLFPTELNLYKVWGDGPNNVFLVGEGGVVIRWDGREFSRYDTGFSDLLFTVHGQSNGPVITVGGLSTAATFSLKDEGWSPEFPEGAPGLNGVFVRNDGMAIASGNRGAILVRGTDEHWHSVRGRHAAEIGGRTLHAVWSTMATWAVGGDLSSMTDGIILTTRTPVPRVEL